MNKKEVAKIRRQMSSKSGSVKKIAAYFVTTDKQCIPLNTNPINLMSDAELKQYFTIFKHVLTGREGSKIHNLEFSNEAEKKGHPQDMLMSIKNDGLSNSEDLSRFIRLLMDNYESEDSYFILFLHGCYGLPTKLNDDESLNDSEEIYNFIVNCICPAKLSKNSLSYSVGEPELKSLDSTYIVPNPNFGFVFPSLNDWKTDIHAILAYTKNLTVSYEPMFSRVLGCKMPLSETEHVDVFSKLTDTAFGGSCSFTEAAGIQMSLNEEIQKHKESNSTEPLKMGRDELASVLNDNYATDIDSFEEQYEELMGDESFIVENLVESKNTIIKTDCFKINIPTDNLHLVSIREIDGIKCLVIKPNNGKIEINGVVTDCR